MQEILWSNLRKDFILTSPSGESIKASLYGVSSSHYFLSSAVKTEAEDVTQVVRASDNIWL